MILRIAHRGASGEKPENTLEAFQRAVELDSDWIELDVRLTCEGEVVICHDEFITKNEFLYCVNQIPKEQFSFFGLNTLDEVLENFLLKINLNIEIKTCKNEDWNEKLIYNVGKKINFYKKKFGSLAKSILITSFHHPLIINAHKYIHNVDFGFLFSSFPLFWTHYINHTSFTHFVFDKSIIDKNIVAQLKEKNIKVWVFTCNHSHEIEEISKIGVDGIISNFPNKIKKY